MDFIKPSLGGYTQNFNRSNKHFGLDIALPGNVAIKAAADGVVSRSYSSTTYGEVIFIVHNINGQTYETVYAHMRRGSRKYSEGSKVKQGDVIGYMGSTGDATGQHLHFEIHKGRWNYSKTNAVDPKDYINQELSPAPKKQFLVLPSNADSWRVYPLSKAPVKGNESGFLNPKKFGGLTYEILAKPQEYVYTIQTSDFGKVNIYGAPSTGAKIVTL